jgi:uncharacterized protein with FMN-binding domain
MRKYLQITVVLGIFSLLVFLKQAIGSNDKIIIVGTPTPSPTNTPPTATPTPVVSVTPQSSGVSPTLTPTPKPTPTPTPKPKGQYKDGSYTGSVEDAFYGYIQVQAKITNGRISDVVFLQAPGDNRTSSYINSQADPMLTQEAIQVQSASVDIISGASASSQAFQASLANALAQAKN